MLYANSPVPLYKQLYSQLRDAIEGGEFETGRRLPSERQLAAEYGVSRLTTRRALDLLQQNGYVRAYRGRGSFVAHSPHTALEPVPAQGFREATRRQGLTARSRVLSQSVVRVSGDVARYLQIRDLQPAIKLRRLRLVDDTPIALDTAYLSYPLCAPLLQVDLERCSLYRSLEEEVKITLAYAYQTLRRTLGQSNDLRLLGLKPPATLVQLRRQTYDGNGQVVEYVEVLYLPDEAGLCLLPAMPVV